MSVLLTEKQEQQEAKLLAGRKRLMHVEKEAIHAHVLGLRSERDSASGAE